MIEMSSLEYAFSKLNFNKVKINREKCKKNTMLKIWYSDNKEIEISQYDYENIASHKGEVCIINLTQADENAKILKDFF